MQFHAEYYRDGWTCGDGCCSDSWVNLDISKDGKLWLSKDELRHIHCEEDAKKDAEEIIEVHFDLKSGEYELELDCNL